MKVQLITFRGTNLILTALLAGELDLTLPDAFVEDLPAVATFRLKEKPGTALTVQSVRD